MLQNRLLICLDEVVRCGPIRAASRKLNVASSAINHQILAVEKDQGTPVFERLPRRLRLTAVGELLIDHVRSTLRGQQQLNVRIADLTGLRWGQVGVATVGTVAAEILPTAIQFVRRDDVDVGIGFDLAACV